MCTQKYERHGTSNVKTWITETYKFIDFAINFILLKAHPALNWNQALLSFGLNRFLVARKIEKSHIWHQKLRVVCFWINILNKQNLFRLPWKFKFMRFPQGYHLQRVQHQGLRNHIKCILVARTKVSQECRQILEKPGYTCI